MIQGLITARHLFLHAPTIVRQFGAAVWLRCWRAILRRRRTTFLECPAAGTNCLVFLSAAPGVALLHSGLRESSMGCLVRCRARADG